MAYPSLVFAMFTLIENEMEAKSPGALRTDGKVRITSVVPSKRNVPFTIDPFPAPGSQSCHTPPEVVVMFPLLYENGSTSAADVCKALAIARRYDSVRLEMRRR